jgi:hypothetical protein
MLGYISPAAVAKLTKDGWIPGIELTDDDTIFCETCTALKIKCLPFSKEYSKLAITIGDVVHSDVWGPATIKTPAWELTYKYSTPFSLIPCDAVGWRIPIERQPLTFKHTGIHREFIQRW